MTRGQEIINTIEKLFLVTKDCKPTYEMIGFRLGAEWADSNPKSPWISVNDDLPCNHSDLVLTYNNIPFSTKRVMVLTDIHTLFLCEMKKDNNLGWIWNYSTKDKITHWFSIPKLPE